MTSEISLISPESSEHSGSGRGEIHPDVIPADTVVVIETAYRKPLLTVYDRARGRQVNVLNGGSAWPNLDPALYMWTVTDKVVTPLKPDQYTVAHYESSSVFDSRDPHSYRIIVNIDGKAKRYLNHALRRAWVRKKGYEYVEPVPNQPSEY